MPNIAVPVPERGMPMPDIPAATPDVETFPVELRSEFSARVFQALGVPEEDGGEITPVALPVIEPVAHASGLPLSFAQQRIWFLEQFGDPAHPIVWCLRLRGELDRDALRRALDRIVVRHAILRTTIRLLDGEPKQCIAPAGESGFALLDHDLSACVGAGAQAELVRLAAAEAEAPFSLERGPLVRGRLIRLEPADHVLLVTLHSLVADVESLGVFTHELSTLYAAFLGGKSDPLPTLPVQYGDYAAWQRRLVSGGGLGEQAAYWTETLAGIPELLAVPADRLRPVQANHAGALAGLELDDEVAEALRALGSRYGATLPTTLLAGWAAVLGRLSGQTDVVIGTAAANRGRAEVDGLIGRFADFLPVRVDLSGSPTAAELVERVEARVRGARANQDLPFQRVVDLVQVAGAASPTPLFQAAFIWQDTLVRGPALPSLQLSAVPAPKPHSTADFDLSLNLREEGGRVVGEVGYATALFDRETVERYASYLRRVLQGMAADETRRVDRLALLSAAERGRVVEEWNRTYAPYPDRLFLHERFEAQAERTPDAVAVVFEDRRLTYGELNGRANRLAHHLRERGVGPDARVGICVQRGLDMVVGLLGVLKAGGAYLPLDPGYPWERLVDMAQDSAPVVLLTHGSLLGRLAGLEVPVVALDADADWWGRHPATNPVWDGLTPEHLAYVIYTSGSTGRPKGVQLMHRAVSNLVHWYMGATRISERDSVLIVTSFSFHLTQRNLLAPLFAGGQLHLASEPFEPRRITARIAASAISMMSITPTAFQALVEADAENAIGGMRLVVFGGETVYPRQLARVPEPRPEFLNVYGPTEGTGVAASHAVRADPTSYVGRSVPLGRPIPNARVYILDGAGEPVPVGVAGELYIGGTGVTRGYRRRPRQTAERFVPDPFGAKPGARLYRTGDLGRWLPDGTIEFMGRNDAQVKVRGFRVELEEIEARLSEHADVREAVVVARDEGAGESQLVAYYVGDDAGAEALRAHLAARLPEYMVPAAYVRLGTLPLTANGKLDRRALPAPGGDTYARHGYVAPAGRTEAALAEIWSEQLGVDRVGVHDSFFELGGHSLSALRMLSRVRQVLNVDVGLVELFQRPVLADFARGVNGAARAALSAIEPVERGTGLPLSFPQQRLWFLEQLGGLGAAYHMARRLRLQGGLDRPALLGALDRIVARHEALRTTFHTVDGELEQHIAPVERGGFYLLEHDLSGHPQAEAEPELARVIAEETGSPFDLAGGPLVRGRLVCLGPEDHVLLVTMHHLVSDGWSMDVFVQELGALYGAFRRGEPDSLPPLPVQYVDYAAWQRRLVSGELLRKQAEYWKETLAGAPELLELPVDHARPLQQDHGGDRVGLELDETLTAELRALGGRHGATLFMTVLAGWAATLGRLSGQTEVVIGAPTANRGRREIEGLIGFFVNTLALRLDLSGAPTAAELLERVRVRSLEAQQNQDIPFEQVVERMQPVRSLAHSPLFQVMLSWQSTPPVRPELPGLAFHSLGGEPDGTAKFDLTLSLAESGGRITGDLTYATALFERGTVERHLGYLRRVLKGMTADEHRPLDRLPLLSEGERRQVMAEWNATAAAFPGGVCIHHLFEAQVERTPDSVALVHRGESLTYAELNARSNRLAHHLRARGVGPDARVAICTERGLEMMVGLLGVLKAGGAYVPLDPAYPVERLRYMLENSAPAALLTQAGLDGVPAPADVPVVDLSAPAPEWADGPAANPDCDRVGLTPGHLAYVIYTSGSTGQPKGVMVGHGGVVNLLWSMRDVVGMAPGDRFLSVTTIAFDIAALELFLPLACGACTVILDRSDAAEPVLLAAAISREEATVLQATPATWRMLVEGGWEGRDGLRALCGGEALGSGLAAQVRERVRALWNVYGPTETTIWSSAAVRAGEANPGGRPHAPIGRPLANTQFYVLDGGGEPVPVGVVGELYIGGAGVTRGYRGRPGQTADRFVPDPFGAKPGARLYRTGDLGRWLPDGTIEFMGRNDAQVKVRGFRVELGEIEARLAEHPEVREAVAVVPGDGPGGDRLVAYYVGGDAGAEALRAHLAERLPEYMLPAAYVRLPALPLTANGKLDRRALPAPDGDAYARRGYEAPVGGTETALAEIWSELLGVDRVGVHDNFFELGGHSLLAMRVISRVRQVFAVELPPQTLFVASTVAAMAARVDELRRAGLPVPRSVVSVARTGPAPLSFAQERFWFLDRLQPGSAFYNIPIPLRLSGALEAGALERALGEIVRRHEALRTTFLEREGTPLQGVAPFRGFRLPVKDLSRFPAKTREAEVQREALADAARPFDLAAGPLFRASLLRLDAGEHVLLVCMHHIVGDGWSLGVLFREMSTLYEAYRAGRMSPLPELPVQYADYALWQRESLRDATLEREMAYWREQLAGAPALLELPTDYPRPAVQSYRGKGEAMELPAELLARLRAVGRREGATLYMVLLGAWQMLLAKYAGTADVVVGSPIAGRTRREVEELIGLFVNTLVLRTDLSGDPSFGEVLRRVREPALGAYAHQDLPFERLVAELQPERSLSHSPLFQVLFSLGNAGGTGAEIPGMRIERVETEVQTTPFDLHLAFFEEPGGLRAVLRYSTDLFERGTIVRMLGHLRQVLEQVAGDVPPRFSQLQVMGAAERRQIVDEWNDTAADYPADRCSHELFEAQVELTPCAVAVVSGETELTYGELNVRANRLAHRLREHGVGPDARVGICAQRGVEMVTGLLAILKAGGAYVPLDPAYPADRLRFMLADSNPRVLLTHGVSSELFAGSEVTVIDLAAQAPSWASHSPANPHCAGLVPDNLCYVIYTSGSTGRPKGVAMPHRALVNLVAWQEPDCRRPRAAATLQFASFGFDVSFQEIFATWSTGGRLVIAGEEARHDPSAVLDLVERQGVERLSLPYAMLQLVAEHAVACGRAPASLREVQTAGEALRITEPIRRWFSALNVPLHNQYGPSETHVVTAFTLKGSAESWPPLPSIGTPITNARVYALDRHLSPVPQGVQGELLLGGVCLARGYLDRPALTAERFIPDPFAPEPGARMYRTGDRVRWLDDGTLDFLGRLDHQVKIRGFRIEPGEVEAALRRYPGIAECAVVAREEAPGEWRLVGYVAGEVESQGLREHLRAGLPEHMVPSAIVCLPSLPVTLNGKLDRAALPAPEYEPAGGAYEAPRTRVEEVLAGIWAEVLRLERVGVRDNFFELGGHSLLATRVVSRIREVLRSDLSVRAIFESPTIEGLARFVAEEQSIDLSDRTDLPGEQPESSRSNPYRLLSVLEELSDDELDRLLSTEP